MAIEGGVSGEAGGVVDFEEVGVEFVVDHDVEAQHLKAHVVGEVVGVDGQEGTWEGGVAGDNGFDENLIDFSFELLNIMSVILNLLVYGGKGPLMPDVHLVDGLVEDEVRVFLIYRIVC